MLCCYRAGRQVLGAVHFGQKETAIVSRKARLTYGTGASMEYDPSDAAHIQRKCNVFAIANKLYLNVFEGYVERGDDLPVGTTREQIFRPITEYTTSMNFNVFISKKRVKDIRFSKDEGFQKLVSVLTTIRIPLDMEIPFHERGISLQLTFGGTELGVKCTRLCDGHEVNVDTVYVEEMADSASADAELVKR